jgi:hypothetical protein
MRPLHLFWSSLLLLFTFVIQESVVSSVHLPIAGYSLYLAVATGIMTLEDRIGAIVLAFIAGLILDLSPSGGSPLGQWALTLTLTAVVISYFRDSIGSFASRPIAFILFTSSAIAFAIAFYLIVNLVLGEDSGDPFVDVKTLLGITFWNLIFSPIVLPIVNRIHTWIVSEKARI